MSDPARRWFYYGLLFEAGLGGLGILGAQWLHLPWTVYLQFGWRDAGWGVGETLPLLVLLCWLRKTSAGPIRRIRAFLDESIQPVLGQWSVWQFALMAGVAGVAEELLFRGLIQAALGRLIGTVAALFVASALFGCFHAVTRAYVVLAGAIGFYLGLAWLVTGSLAAAMVAHGLYDLVALLCFVRRTETGPLRHLPQNPILGEREE